MLQTVFVIPNSRILGVPLLVWNGYGVGWVFWLFLLLAGGRLAWRARREGLTLDVRVSAIFVGVICLGIVFALPMAVESDGLAIRGYGVMFLLAVVSGVGLALYRARQMGIHREIILGLAFAACLAGLVGARVLYVAEYWNQEYRHHDSLLATLRAVLNFTKGGLVVYGALLGAAAAFVWYVRKYKLPALALADVIVPSLLVGQGLGRIGCFLNGCCFGGACELPLAVRFPMESPVFKTQVMEGKLPLHGITFQRQGVGVVERVQAGSPAAAAGLRAGDRILGVRQVRNGQRMPLAVNGIPLSGRLSNQEQLLAALLSVPPRTPYDLELELIGGGTAVLHVAAVPRSNPVHPSQLYAAGNALLLGLFAWYYFPFRRRDGEVFTLMLSVFPLVRILEEYIRVDEPQNFLLGMTISQTISVGLLLAAGALWAVLLRKPKGSATQAEDWVEISRRYAEQAA